MDFEVPGQILWDNMLLCNAFPIENVLKVPALELEPTDVVIASYPKTGTTLLQELVWLIRNNGDLDKANRTPNTTRVPFMELQVVNPHQAFAELEHPRHMKTHLPYHLLPKSVHEGRSKVVYIMRNPKDCLVSYYHFHRINAALGKFKGSWDEFFEYFKKNNYILNFGNPIDHFRAFWEHKDDENVHIVFYEHCLKEPKPVVLELAKFLECELTDDVVEKIVEATRFDAMKTNPMTNMSGVPNFVMDQDISKFMRKGQVGDWKNYFNEEQNTILDKMEREKLEGTGVTFDYE